MTFEDFYRISVHAVLTNEMGQVLLLKATYAEKGWGLPGGTLDKGETVHQALYRECIEELGLAVNIEYLSGIYYHHVYNSHALVFRCHFATKGLITLSDEHSEYGYFNIADLSPVQQQRINDSLHFDGQIKSAAF